jgi:hypothetical protein
MNAGRPTPVGQGAYGFRLRGLPEAAPLLVDAPASWPALSIEATVSDGPAPDFELNQEFARLSLRTGGWVAFERAAGRVLFTLREPLPEAAIVHPLLGAAVIVPAFWLGRESFHAGAFVVDGGAWAVLGERTEGKSTLLAALGLMGVPIVADDILVLDRTTALAGPRSVDLREPAARALGGAQALGRVGDRERWRLALGDVAPEVPLRGWIGLRWGEQPSVEPVRGSDRLRRIAAQRAFLLDAPDPALLLELSSLPVLEFTRPRRFDAIAAGNDVLLSALSGVGRG